MPIHSAPMGFTKPDAGVTAARPATAPVMIPSTVARELKVPVLTCAQLSRMPERREDKRPVLSDLRESGSIEAEADVVGLLYRQAYYDQKEVMDSKSMEEGGGGPGTGVEKVQETEIIIAKHRNGPTGTIKLGFLPRYACFQDLEIGRTEE